MDFWNVAWLWEMAYKAGERSIELNHNSHDLWQHYTQGEVCFSFSGKSGVVSLLRYREVILCAFFLNNEVPHKNWAVLLKYSFLKKRTFLSVDSYD